MKGTGEIVGLVRPSAGYSVPLQFVDLSSGGDDAVDEAMAVEARRPFDLENDPLMRGALFRASPSEATLALTLHHSVSDAWSTGVLTNELTAAYNAFKAAGGAKLDLESVLEPLPVQYADFVVWQLRTLEQRGEALRSWWQEALRGAPPLLQLPLDRPRPEATTSKAGNHHLELPPQLMTRLAQLAARLGVNMQALLLAGVMVGGKAGEAACSHSDTATTSCLSRKPAPRLLPSGQPSH
jgi:hypothetical protein